MNQPLESAIGKGWISKWDHLNTISGNAILARIEGVPIAQPAPHIQKPLLFLDFLDFIDGEGSGAASSAKSFWPKQQGGGSSVIVSERVPDGQRGFSELVVNVIDQISGLGFPAISPDGSKRPAADMFWRGMVLRLFGGGIDFKKWPEILDKNEWLSINFQGTLRKASLSEGRPGKNDSKQGDDNRGGSRDKPVMLVRITNNPSQYGWPEMIGAAILLMITIGCAAYLITGGK